MDLKRFHWEYNGSVVFVPAFEVVLACKEPLKTCAAGFSAFYREFIARYGGRFTTYSGGTMSSWRKTSARALQLLPAYLSDARNFDAPDFGIEFHSAPEQISMLPPAIRFCTDRNGSYIAATVPPDILNAGPAAAVALVQGLIGTAFPFTSGWAGYAVAWNESMTLPYGEPREQLRAWIQRYPGLGQGNNFAIYDRALHGIAHVNWLTLLGPELTAQKGGQKAVSAALGPDITVHPLGDGVCIQAGQTPELGDVNRGDDLPLYRKVGSFLKDIRTTEPERWLDGPEDDTEVWFARFDA